MVGPNLDPSEIMRESIQMFRGLTPAQKYDLYDRIKGDDRFPAATPETEYAWMDFHIFMKHPKFELNSIVGHLVKGNVELNDALTIYEIVHDKLLEMGIEPAPGAMNEAPPKLPWVDGLPVGFPRRDEIRIAVYGNQNGGKRKSRRTRKSKHRKSRSRKSRK